MPVAKQWFGDQAYHLAQAMGGAVTINAMSLNWGNIHFHTNASNGTF